MNNLFIILIIASVTWFATAIGAAIFAFLKDKRSATSTLAMGFAAGVIIMVSFVELLHPAIEAAEMSARIPAWLAVPLSFGIGFGVSMLLDKKLHDISHERMTHGKADLAYKHGFLLSGSLSAHTVPEGLALGVLLGTLGAGFSMGDVVPFIPIILAIGLHTIPEGSAAGITFRGEGASTVKSFIFGQSSGFLGFVAGVIGFFAAINIDAIIPYAMGIAGGAMIWVALHELIPKCVEKRTFQTSMVGVFLGIFLMLFIDALVHH